MRIGIMCHASFGGSARIATELAIELARRKHRVHLFTRTLPFGNWDDGNGVHVHTFVPESANDMHPAQLYTNWSNTELQDFVCHISNIAVNEKLDVLHFHYAVPFAQAAIEVCHQMKTIAPVLVGTLHGTDVSNYGRNPDTGPHLAKMLCDVDALTTVSRNYARLAKEVFQLPESPQVIPNFVDLTRFRPQGTQCQKSQERLRLKPRLIHISNFRPVKDPQSMARIFAGIREQTNAELWLIGDGPEMSTVKAIFQQNGIDGDVRYWGLQRDVAPILSQADLILITSLQESFCLVALEAMACGVPVLSTNVGGLPEVVVDGKTGWLFPVDDHDMAVELALNILSDPILHQRMREASIRHASQFERAKIVPTYEVLYKKLLLRRSSPGVIQFHGKRPSFVGTHWNYGQGV